MGDLDRYSDVLPADVRAVWPQLAAAVADIDGALFGGTALATHLQHRHSFDLDYMTYTYFDGEQLADRLTTAAQVDVQVAAASQLRAVVDGVVVEVFAAPHPSDDPSRVQQVAAPAVIDGLAVASIGDLLAAKLDVLLWRAKLRDFIDIAAVDQSKILRIEDGLRLHTHRYGTPVHSGVLDEIVDLLEDPGVLTSDPVFAEQAASTLTYLASRVPELRDYLGATRAVSGGTPPPRSRHAAASTAAETADAIPGDTPEPRRGPMAAAQLILVDEPAEHVRRVTLNRPAKRNAISKALRAAVLDALHGFDRDPSVRVTIVRGAGPCFSSGYDLSGSLLADSNTAKQSTKPPYPSAPGDGQWTRQASDGWFSIWDLAKPVIAQVHGYAYAGGTELAAACDLVYVAADARIGYPVVRVASPPDWQYHTPLMGLRHAMEAMLTGDSVSGAEAVRMGWANRAYPPEELEEAVLAMAVRIAGVAPDLAQINKRMVHRAFDVLGGRAAIRSGQEFQALAAHQESVKAAAADLLGAVKKAIGDIPPA